ncbi:MAG: hypothetical protein E2O44_07405 [Nitrospina sp.]|nr:MAG: hypothetical protein E2O44_07405 [Nitrospina sp.]
MPSLKGILFNQFASEGLNLLVEELQASYKPKKGRRFHHNNITYEISRPEIKGKSMEFEISSKIPQDELESKKEMEKYFKDIKNIIKKGKSKPISIEMDNILWDSKKDSEKEREYVKLLYSYPFEDLYDDKEIEKRYQSITQGGSKEKLPDVPGVYTVQGKLALAMVREKIQELGMANIQNFIAANQKVREKLKK